MRHTHKERAFKLKPNTVTGEQLAARSERTKKKCSSCSNHFVDCHQIENSLLNLLGIHEFMYLANLKLIWKHDFHNAKRNTLSHRPLFLFAL